MNITLIKDKVFYQNQTKKKEKRNKTTVTWKKRLGFLWIMEWLLLFHLDSWLNIFYIYNIIYRGREVKRSHVATQFLFRSFVLITRWPFDMVKRAHQFYHFCNSCRRSKLVLCAGWSLATPALPRPAKWIKKLN